MEEEKKKVTALDRLKLNLMCKWMEDYGFDELWLEHPEAQVKFAELLQEYI